MPEKYEQVTMRRRTIIFNNFLGGIAWGIGTFVGLAIILVLVGSVLSRVNLVPIVGNFVSQVAQEAIQSNPRLIESPQ